MKEVMTKKKDDSEISYFMEDAILFSLWAFSNPNFYPKEYFDVGDISPFDRWQYERVFDFLIKRLEMVGVAVPEIDYYSDIDEGTLKPLSTENLKKQNVEIKKAARKFLNNNFSIKEIKILAPIFHEIYEIIYFQPKFSKEDVKKMLKQIDEYIEKFLNNELFVYDRNYLSFEKQKQFFVGKIRKMSALEKYGENFVISTSSFEKDDDEDADEEEAFLFVHTLYALQKLGYIGVLRLWCKRDTLRNKHLYFANIVANDILIDEVTNSFRKENPATTFEGYDEKHNLLKFAGKAIELSKKNKETDAVLLIKTLRKEPERYWFNDELLEDWGYQPHDETAKNKAYFAARKINEAVKMKTGIDDFIDHNTSKFRINPKYLKVDE